jgi:hypothetical protein
MRLLGERWPPVERGGTLFTALSVGYTLVAGAWTVLLLVLGGIFGPVSTGTISSALLMLCAVMVVLRVPSLPATRELSRYGALRIAACLHLVAGSVMYAAEANSEISTWFIFALMPAGGLFLGANSMLPRVRAQ